MNLPEELDFRGTGFQPRDLVLTNAMPLGTHSGKALSTYHFPFTSLRVLLIAVNLDVMAGTATAML